METSYLIWQEQALLELQAEREAKAKAAGQAVMGIAVIALGVLAAAASSGSSNDNTRSLGVTAGALGAIGGASLISNSFQTSREAEVHRDALNELGESINVDLATQVIEFEEQTVSLTGDAKGTVRPMAGVPAEDLCGGAHPQPETVSLRRRCPPTQGRPKQGHPKQGHPKQGCTRSLRRRHGKRTGDGSG